MEIYIKHYPVFMKVGHYQEERIRPQEVFISARLQFQVGDRIDQEDLGSTIDYGKVIALIDQTLTGKEIKLLEFICDVLGKKLLAEFELLQSIWVRVEKSIIPQGLNKGAKVQVANLYERH